jgi:hypothetical protein
MTNIRLIYLMDDPALVTPQSLDNISTFADGIGPSKYLILPCICFFNWTHSRLVTATSANSVIQDAHKRGLLVHAWTFRAEKPFVHPMFANIQEELRYWFQIGVDGVFIDQPDEGITARNDLFKSPILAQSSGTPSGRVEGYSFYVLGRNDSIGIFNVVVLILSVLVLMVGIAVAGLLVKKMD